MSKDQIYKTQQKKIKSFAFNKEVAQVFDDMVERSIPFYNEIHKIILDLSRYSLDKSSLVYDLGCSTGTTIAHLEKYTKDNGKYVEFIGVDNSPDMLELAHKKLKRKKVRSFQLICSDIEKIDFQKCDMIIMNYTLQFLPMKERKMLIKKIFKALKPGGVFILSEKINSDSPQVHSLITDLYYDFKRRNGYSELEIAQKREALEKVLIPMSMEQQLKLLHDGGFKKREMIFRWYNFASFLGVK